MKNLFYILGLLFSTALLAQSGPPQTINGKVTYNYRPVGIGNSTFLTINTFTNQLEFQEAIAGLALGETSTTAYRGDRGKIAYDHSQTTGNPHNTQIGDISGLQTSLNSKANDADVVHKTGNETIFNGTKTFLSSTVNAPLAVNNNSGLTNSAAITILSAADIGLYSTNFSGTNYINAVINGGSSSGGIKFNYGAMAQGNFFEFLRNNVLQSKIDYLGNITGNSFVKIGGTSSQFLKADGSIDATSYQPTLSSGTTIKTIEGQSLLGSGNIDLTKSDVGLGNVDNTSDANKPISTATQTALNAKLTNVLTNGRILIGSGSNMATEQAVTGDVTISNTGVTSILGTGTGNIYARQASPTFTGTPSAPTAVSGTNTTQIATTAFVTSGLSGKQDALLSGTNIKTVGGQTLLGSGDVTEVQNSLTASTTLAPSVTAVNNGLTLKANDADVVKLTGTQTVAGAKTFTSSVGVTGNGLGYILGNAGNNASILYNSNGNLDITPRSGFNTIITAGKLGVNTSSIVASAKSQFYNDVTGMLSYPLVVSSERGGIFTVLSSTNTLDTDLAAAITKSATPLTGATPIWLYAMFGNGNTIFGGTGTDGGYKLDVQGTFRATGQVTVPTPTASTSAVNRGYVEAYASKTANYTLTANDWAVDFTSGNSTATLPTAVGITGKQYLIKNSGTGVTTVATTSSQTIDGLTSVVLFNRYSNVEVVSDGANWKVRGTYNTTSVLNSAFTTSQTAATLNSAYPNAPVPFVIYAPNVGSGIVYIKTTTGGQWMMYSGSLLNP